MASWARARGTSSRIAWLTARARRDSTRDVWTDMLAALESVGVRPPAEPVTGAAASAQEASIRGLAVALEHVEAPITLIIDDLHRLDDAKALAALTLLLRDPPERLRLVLISRSEPRLPLHQLRAAGELTVIGRTDLAFTADEAAALLNGHDNGLNGPARRDLLERTEGWAVGLSLATAVDPVPESVADYLLREVVAGQPEDVRRLMLRTSVLDEMNAELAEVLTGYRHSAKILERLVRANAFVIRSPGRSQWYCFHPELREVLRNKLHRDHPEDVAPLHRLAAQWFARRGAFESLDHAAAAADWPMLGRLVVEFAVPLIVSTDRMVLVETLKKIPSDQFPRSAELTLCGTLLLFSSGDYLAVPEGIARIRAMLSGRTDQDRLIIEVAVHLLEAAAVIRVRGDMPRLVASTTEVVRRLATARLDRLPSLLQYRAVALANKGVGLLWCDETDAADRYLWAGLTGARTAGVQLVEMNALGHLGLLAFRQGSLREAEQYALPAQQIAQRYTLHTVPQATAAYLTSALVALERDRQPEVEESLRRALHSDAYPPEAALIMTCSLVRAHALLARDEPMAARALLGRLRQELNPPLVAPMLERWLQLTESEADLVLGDHARVVARYEAATRGTGLTPAEQVCLGRAYLALGDLARGEDLLGRAAESSDMVSAVTAWIAAALLADASGHGNRSIDALARAQELASRDGIRRPFRKFDQRRVAALVERRQWLDEQAAPPTGSPTGDLPLTQALSERERDVLRYMPTVLTAAEIAGDLKISVNTVKAHMRSIYRKLSAARRREAVVRARELGLL